MLFHSPAFFFFFAVVLIAFYSLPFRLGKLALLAASYVFYIFWNPRFIVLLLLLTVVDYWAARLIETLPSSRRRLALVASVAANLAFLGFFKYYNFFASDLAALLRLPSNSFFIEVVLPLGISFHTFQSISYVVDVYRGQQSAIASFPDYALFISFFPQLVAGPIVRAREFFRDLYNWSSPSVEAVQRGTVRFLAGLIKKMVFADRFAQIADPYFSNVTAQPGMWNAWSGAFAFALQIYFDFSGYTDMAIGLAAILGFHFPENFGRPYLADSVTEFWRRWHMSLSRWLRDYLYIPLGGNRRGLARTYRNLMITMVLGGLWHGASWNFLIWGGWHGALLSVEKAAGNSLLRIPRFARIGLTFLLVLIGWVFFRTPGLGNSLFVLRQMFAGQPGTVLLGAGHLALIATALAGIVLENRWHAPPRLQTAAIFAMLVCLEFFSVTGEQRAFIYFQF